MLYEEECVLLRESNMEDPLADPLDFPQSDPESSSDEETSSDESDKSEPEVAEEVMKYEDYPHECDICGKRFKTMPGIINLRSSNILKF